MSERNRRKTKVGIVTSNKMDKTIVVGVEESLRHDLYGKNVKKTKKFLPSSRRNMCSNQNHAHCHCTSRGHNGGICSSEPPPAC